MMWLYAWFASDPIFSLVLSIQLAAFGSVFAGMILVVLVLKANASPRFFGFLPLFWVPLGLWLYESHSDHRLYRNALLKTGRTGTLTVYDTKGTGMMVNHVRVMDYLGLVKDTAQAEPYSIRFHTVYSLSCLGGNAPAIILGQVYPIVFNPASPTEFCIRQTPEDQARIAECRELQAKILEQSARQKLSPSDDSIAQGMQSLLRVSVQECGGD
jgi:hypothetical protein